MEAEKNRIGTEVFKMLISKIELQESTFECIGMSSAFGPFEISFHVVKMNNYKLHVDDFGFTGSGKWTQCKPTFEQKGIMEDLIINELQKLNDEVDEKAIRELEQIQFEKDCYKYGEVGF